MKAHQALCFVVFCAIVLGTVAHSHHRRDLLQNPRQGGNAIDKLANEANDGKGHKHGGKIFDFSADGGAASFLANLDQDKLQRVVQKSGWTKGIGGLAKQLTEDADFGLDLENEAALFACEGLSVSNSEIASGLSPSALDPNYAQAFNLASRPASTKKIWLDFDGCVITNSFWNNANLPSITIPAFDTDNNPAAFSNLELSDIVTIWRAVSEDYSPFDVDVTTIPPSSSIDPNLVARACIGGNGSWWGQAGGVAYVNVFGTSNNVQASPAFIFPDNLVKYPKYIWEAISHEIGHNMGLSHDGQGTTDYYSGQGDWAPIMGVGYYKNVSQWSKGEYSGATNTEDDTAIIAGKLSYVPALNGNIQATATPLAEVVSGSTATGTATGIVTTPGAADFFSFSASAGTATISGQVVADWASNAVLRQRSDLDMLITLYSSSGATIVIINPPNTATANGLGVAAVSVNLPSAGKYYVSVAGSGSGDVSTTGYSNYASLGQFGISVVYPVAAQAAPPPPVQATPPPPTSGPPPSTSSLPTLSVPFFNITGPTAVNNKRFTCTARVVVQQANTGTPVGGATLDITWSTLTGSSGFPYSTTVTTSSDGVATIVSNRIQGGKGCRYSVTDVSAAGYATLSTDGLLIQEVSF